MTPASAKHDVLILRSAGDRAIEEIGGGLGLRARWPVYAAANAGAARCDSTQHDAAFWDRHILHTRTIHVSPGRPPKKLCNIHATAPADEPPKYPRRRRATRRHRRAQALAKLQSTRASLTDYAVELDKSADARTGYKAKYADGKDYVLQTYEKTKTQVNEYAVEPTTTYATETYAYVGDKFVSTKDYAADTYDSAKTYTYDTTLSLVENAKAMTEKMMLAMGSRKEAPETVAAEAEVMEA